MDFLKLTSLLFMKKINTITFLTILGTIFKILPKKLHGKYFSFLKVLLKFLFTHKKTIFQGIKFEWTNHKITFADYKYGSTNIGPQDCTLSF